MSFLAIDLGGTQFKSALISEDFQLEQSFSERPSARDLEDCQKLLQDMIAPHLDTIEGIAISCPGTTDPITGTVYNGGMLQYLDGFSFKAFLEKSYQKPVAVLNDGKAAALAELASGNLKGVQNGLAMIVGTGLGGGIIINGELYQGSHFQAGELTFALPQDKMSPLSGEDLAGGSLSAVNVIARCAKALGLSEEQDGRAVFEAIKRKDERVYSIFQGYCRQFALQINNLQSILDVERVVIGGGISAQAILIEEVNRQLDQLETENAWVFKVVKRPQVTACFYQNSANLIGAAYYLEQTM
ncbi:ROK family protein [Streptococcus thoraltensis]|uniref:ROK family protein n=1 Tax=Streptococcus thoraltensis TaxID=55085 RepID=UPI0003687FF5|nr:ROK family protein [Streptococcus thoraltensis]MDY4760541.1 ROK family protein [Streptococcus thoraltensis]